MKYTNIVGIMAVMFTSSLALAEVGADIPQVRLECKTPFVADSGYQVVVESGGFAGLTTARVLAVTFAGTEELDHYYVSFSRTTTESSYTSGDSFVLSYSASVQSQSEATESSYDATFRAMTSNGEVSGPLICHVPTKNK